MQEYNTVSVGKFCSDRSKGGDKKNSLIFMLNIDNDIRAEK